MNVCAPLSLSIRVYIYIYERVCMCMSVCVGMTVSALRDGAGVFIRSVVSGGAISKDGRLKVGDGILAFNGEPTTNLTNTQARAMLRRHSLIGPELRYVHTHTHTLLYMQSGCTNLQKCVLHLIK